MCISEWLTGGAARTEDGALDSDARTRTDDGAPYKCLDASRRHHDVRASLERRQGHDRRCERLREVDTAWVLLLCANRRTCITSRHIEGEPASTPCEAAHGERVMVPPASRHKNRVGG